MCKFCYSPYVMKHLFQIAQKSTRLFFNVIFSTYFFSPYITMGFNLHKTRRETSVFSYITPDETCSALAAELSLLSTTFY